MTTAVNMVPMMMMGVLMMVMMLATKITTSA